MADNGSAFGKAIAAEEGSFLALPDYKFAVITLVAVDSSGFGRRLGRQDIAVLVDVEDGLAVWIVAASEEGAESPALVHHRFAAMRAFVLADFFLYHPAFFVAWTGKLAVRVSRAA
jgi:hypothetical protein